MSSKLRSQKGFTLVEVIVVAVIVAILAAVAIPVYNSYVSASARNTAENTASSAASFIQAAISDNPTVLGTCAASFPSLTAGGTMTHNPTSSGVALPAVTWECPTGALTTVNCAGRTVTCTIKGETSQPYSF